MSKQLSSIQRDAIVRGMTTEVTDEYDEYLACTADNDFFFRIREYKHGERIDFFVVGVVIRDRNPARWIDFPTWIKLE